MRGYRRDGAENLNPTGRKLLDILAWGSISSRRRCFCLSVGLKNTKHFDASKKRFRILDRTGQFPPSRSVIGAPLARLSQGSRPLRHCSSRCEISYPDQIGNFKPQAPGSSINLASGSVFRSQQIQMSFCPTYPSGSLMAIIGSVNVSSMSIRNSSLEPPRLGHSGCHHAMRCKAPAAHHNPYHRLMLFPQPIAVAALGLCSLLS